MLCSGHLNFTENKNLINKLNDVRFESQEK